jgi:4-amino-4-deoxy-L-arabinose transferase
MNRMQTPTLAHQRTFAKTAFWCLALMFIAIYLIPLSIRPLVVPDEARYGVIPAEMIDTGEWIVPHLAGIRYFEKPVLGYWMTAVSFLCFGENAFALRLPAALMSGVAIVCITLFTRRWTGRWDLAALSGVVLATSLEPVVLGTTAVLDAPFSACVTATVVFFYLATRARGGPRFGWLVAAGLACGAAFLIKGFLAVALPGLVLAPWLAWSGKWKELVTLPWIPAIVATLTAVPWALAVHERSDEYWNYFFWVEHVHRFTAGGEAQHPEPWWFFLPIICVGFIPWVFAAPLAVLGLVRRGMASDESRLLICWLILPLAFFSISSGKLPTYILPCFPPAAALMAVGLVDRFSQTGPRRGFKEMLPGGVLIVLGGLAVAAVFVVPVDPLDGGPWQDGGVWRLPVLGAMLIFWGGADWVSQRTDDGRSRVLIGGLGSAGFLAIMSALMPTGWMTIAKSPVDWMKPWRSLAERSTVLAGRDFIHVAHWTWPEAEIRLFGEPGELRWGVETFEEHAEAHIEKDEFAAVARAATLEDPVLLIATFPEWRTKWIDGLVEAGEVEEPAVTTDRNVYVAVWPAQAMESP